MKIDFATLAFGYLITTGGGTPNWSTSLGQNREYKINADPEINELIKGMIYKSVPLSRISTKIGRGGVMHQGNEENSPIVMAALFDNVYINETKIEDGSFIIIITRDTTVNHYGRLKFKYGPSNTYKSENNLEYSNADFWKTMRSQLDLNENACFFVYDISVENQDLLRLKTVIVDKKNSQSYNDSKKHHQVWENLIFENDKKCGWANLASNTQSGEMCYEAYGDKNFIENPKQIIYYGVPGSGKSNMIDGIVSRSKILPSQKVRVVFHPDYSNVDFVGQIMPQKDGQGISYEFKEGPFTSILMKAYEKPSIPFYLIIEEINRGNASAIFGDAFQLLDRDSNGWSQYEITNEEVSKKVFGEDKAKEMEYKIKLPPNLSILATMNTSDQNVFTLDNAFQRRWSMIHVKNEFKQNDESKTQKEAKIEGTNLTWEKFLFGEGEKLGINTIISKSSSISGMSSLEDKRLGCWFIVNRNGVISRADFSNKVLKYLWDDAFHFDKSVFVEGIESFDDLVDSFENKHQVFKDLEIPYLTVNDNTSEVG